ncbi:MAG: hypothetical protein IJU19_04490 [Bacteroidales bacterium]|nr:hypothetical protein [Bacteroidales bacterium]
MRKEVAAWLGRYFMEGVEGEVVEGEVEVMGKVWEKYHGRVYSDEWECRREAEKLEDLFGWRGVRVVRDGSVLLSVRLARPVVRKEEVRKASGEVVRQVVEHLQGMGIKVYRMDADAEEVPSDVQKATKPKRKVTNKELNKSEKKAIQRYIETLPEDTDTANGLYYYDRETGTIYKFDTSITQYADNRVDGRDGFVLKDKRKIGQLTEDELKEIKDGNYKAVYDRRNAENGNERRADDDSSITNENGSAAVSDVELDRQSHSVESDGRRSDSSSRRDSGAGWIKTGHDGTKAPRYVRDEEMRSQHGGRVLGYVKTGEMWLAEDGLDADTPIHEYTHLWDAAVAAKNPELWRRGVELMKQTRLWSQVEQSRDYGQKWKDLPAERREYLIASEVHSRLQDRPL